MPAARLSIATPSPLRSGADNWLATRGTCGIRNRLRPTTPWRSMPFNGMTPHVSGATLSAQARYAAGTREILECFFENRPIRQEYLIVEGGRLAGTGAHSYGQGNA